MRPIDRSLGFLAVLVCAIIGWSAVAAHAFDACSADEIIAAEPNCPADPSVPCRILSSVSVPFPLCVLDFGRRELEIGSDTLVGAILPAEGKTLRIIAGSLVVRPKGRIDGSGGHGASIEILVDDRVEVLASGNQRGRIDVSGDAGGGYVTIDAGGAIRIDGDVLAKTGPHGPDSHGEVVMHALGDLTVSGEISTEHAHIFSTSTFAGDITLDSWANLSATGVLSVTGDPAGTVRLWAHHDLVVGRIDANGDVDGDGDGEVDLHGRRGVEIIGPIDLRDGNNGDEGIGGNLFVESPLGSIHLHGKVFADSRNPFAQAGEVRLDAGEDVEISEAGAISATNLKPDGMAQRIYVRGGRDVFVDGPLDGTASVGGEIEIHAGRNIEVGAQVRAAGTLYAMQSQGGRIVVRAGEAGQGNVALRGDLDANSGDCYYGSENGKGGTIAVNGCDLNVEAGAMVRACGQTPGSITLRARHQATIAGVVAAKKLGESGAAGLVQVTHEQTAPPSIAASAETSPLSLVALPLCANADSTSCLTPCAECGNGIVEFPETCDSGSPTAACSGCSTSCQQIVCEATYDCDEENAYACREPLVVCHASTCTSDSCAWINVEPSCAEIVHPCAGDCNRDGGIAASEVARTTRLINECGGRAAGCQSDVSFPFDTCLAADGDENGHLSAGELTHMIANLTNPQSCPAASN